MENRNKDSIPQKQTRPQLSDFVENILEDDIKQTLLEFIGYCKESKMTIRLSSGHLFGVHFKGNRVATIEITEKGLRRGQFTFKDNSWSISVCYIDYESPEFEKFAKDNNITEIIWRNICHCRACLRACVGNQVGLDKKIAGKMFHKVCVVSVGFKNPDAETIECIKKVIERRKEMILASKT